MKKLLETIETMWVAVTFAEHGVLPPDAANSSVIETGCFPVRPSVAIR